MFIIKNPQTIYSKKSNPTDNRFSRVGQWRKDIAIAYKNDPIYREEVPCLINKEREIIYEGNCNEGYPDEIYRTSKGYYLVYYYKDISAPGKDSKFRGPYLKRVISEDGKSDICAIGFEYKSFKNEWYDTKDKNVFITKDMGDGIVEHNNSLYRLEDFKKIGDLPKRFKIESIFEDGLCLLSVPKDNRDFFVIVKNREIEYFFEVNDTNKLVSLIDKTKDSSIINYCTNTKNPIIRLLKKQQKTIEDLFEDEDLNYVYGYTYSSNTISKKKITSQDFEKGINLEQAEIEIIKKLHNTLCHKNNSKEDIPYTFYLSVDEDRTATYVLCIIFESFIVLKFSEYMEDDMYRFYSLDGKCLSNNIYKELGNTKNYYNYPIENNTDFKCKNFYYRNTIKDKGIIIIKDGKLYENRFPDFMFNDKSNSYDVFIREHYISFNGELYDFFFNKISINYVDIKIEEVIKKYLYRLTPNFEIYERPSCYVCLEMNISGKICLPIPRKLNTIYSELEAKKENIPNHIKEINHIRDYIDENGEHYSLYIFKCRPEAYCDKQGHIIYNFNPDKIEL